MALAGNEMAMNQSCYAVLAEESTRFFAHQSTINLISRIKGTIFSGAIFNALVTKDFDEQIVIEPSIELQSSYSKLVKPLYECLETVARENNLNRELLKLLLSRVIQV